ncbi:MAG: hypothetical protein AAF657_00780 [Acidobacteriota bacterium]
MSAVDTSGQRFSVGGEEGAREHRKPYEKPHLRTIDLAAEEVLAVGCKLDAGPGGPIGASCTAASCFAAGS